MSAHQHESVTEGPLSAMPAETWNSASGSRWEQYQALMDERESKLLRAYTTMHVNDEGNLEAATLKGV